MSSFDSYAHDYDAALEQGIAVSGEGKDFFAEQRIRWLAGCLKRRQFAPAGVLDFGCGTGSAARFLVEILGAKSVLGLDLSARSLEVARQTNRGLPAEFRLSSDYTPVGTIDLAFCNGVFHHVPPADRPKIIDYIVRCLRPGGIFALWENSPWSPAARYVMSRIPFDRDAVMVWPREAIALAAGAGLDPQGVDFLFIFPRMLRCFRPLEPYLSRVPLGAQYQLLATKTVPQTSY